MHGQRRNDSLRRLATTTQGAIRITRYHRSTQVAYGRIGVCLKDTIYIEQLKINCVIGVNDWERNVRRRIIVDLTLETDAAKAAKKDCIEDAIDYVTVSERVTDFVQASSYMLIETLAEKIANLVLAEFPISRIRLKLSKSGAISNAKSVSVSIERTH